jgi:hypothetical protein
MDPCGDATTCGGDQSCAAPPSGGSSVCQFNSCGICGDGRVCSGDICWPANAGCKCGTPGCACGATGGSTGTGGIANTGGTGGVVSSGGTGGGVVNTGGIVNIGGAGGDTSTGRDAGAGGGSTVDGGPQTIPSCADPTPPNPLMQSPGLEGGNIESLVARRSSTAGVDTVIAASNGGGLWRSIDSGASWSRVGTNVLEAYVTTLADDGTTFYAGTGNQYTPGAVYTSTDGASWTKRGLIGQAVYAVVAYKGALWAGTDQGVFVSSDQGLTFTSRAGGLPAATPVISLDVDDDYVWAGTGTAGAFRAPAAAGDFAPLSTGLPSGAYVRALKAVKSNGVTTSVLAGVDNGGPMGQGELYEQTDGETWVTASQGFWNDPMAYRRVDEFFQLGGTVYAACDWGGGVNARAATPGSSWTDITGTSIDNRNFLAIAASSDGTSLFLGNFGEGVLTGPTGGSAWSRSNGGLLAQRVYALAAGATDALFAGTEGDGVYRSLDGGKTWSHSSNGLPAGYVWAVDAVDQTVYAGTYGFGVYLSTDNAATWQQANGTGDSALGSLIVVALAHDANGVEYAGTRGGGVWKTIGTDQWAPINVGLTQLSVNTLLAMPDGSLYAGTDGGAVWAFAGNAWTQVGTGLPSTVQVMGLASTPMGGLCAAFGGPLSCMTSPSPTGPWRNLGDHGAAATSLTVADGLLYAGGWGNVLERLDVSQLCWRPEIPLDSQVYHFLTTPTSIVIATNDGLLIQAR